MPAGKFVVIDMSRDGSGEWSKWNNASFFGAPFIWTTLHDFGGTDAMKGDLSRINAIPFAPIETTVWGTGYTPEGIDQNPVYYELMAQTNFHTAPLADLTAYVVDRAHRRYGLQTYVRASANPFSGQVACALPYVSGPLSIARLSPHRDRLPSTIWTIV